MATFELKREILDKILNNPQTVHSLYESLEISNKKEIEGILVALEQEKLIKIEQYQLNKENKKENIEFILKMAISNNTKNCLKIIRPKTRQKSETHKIRKKRKGFKPPRFVNNKNKENIPKTTGMMIKKSKSKIIGKKRKLNEISDNNDDEPSLKRIKYNKNYNKNDIKWDESKHSEQENEKMRSLKYEENFLLKHIEKLRKTNATNTVNKKNENCLSYEELVRLTEKWTIATQEIIQTIIKSQQDKNITISKFLKHFQIRTEQVRWNEEDEEFE